jgi:hypothetical protein
MPKRRKEMLSTDTQAAKDSKLGTRPQREKTNITYYLTLPMHRKLKHLAVDHNMSLQQLLDEALEMLFAKYELGSFAPVPSKR